MSAQALESKVDDVLASRGPSAPAPDFSMREHGATEMPSIRSFLRLKDGNVVAITIGVVVSSAVGGFIQPYLGTYSKWGPVIAGALIMFVGRRSGVVQDLGAGVMIGGLAAVVRDLGILGGTGLTGMNREMSETRETYGGTDGVYPTQPERRVFR